VVDVLNSSAIDGKGLQAENIQSHDDTAVCMGPTHISATSSPHHESRQQLKDG